MKNIFSQRKDFVEGRKRNTFDLTYQNNLTMRFGRLYPVFCKEVIPGDSFRIKPTFGLRFMPLVFPIQTRMQANLHFFYVRNRTLWKDWMDFIGRTKSGLTPPYLDPAVAKEICKTGALGDYFGVPTTIVGKYGSYERYSLEDLLYNDTVGSTDRYRAYLLAPNSSSSLVTALGNPLDTIRANTFAKNTYASRLRGIISPEIDMAGIQAIDMPQNASTTITKKGIIVRLSKAWKDTLKAHSGAGVTNDYSFANVIVLVNRDGLWRTFAISNYTVPDYTTGSTAFTNIPLTFGNVGDGGAKRVYKKDDSDLLYINLEQMSFATSDLADIPSSGTVSGWDALLTFCQSTFGTTNVRIAVASIGSYEHTSSGSGDGAYNVVGPQISTYSNALDFVGFTDFVALGTAEGVSDISNALEDNNPYAQGDVHISALPFRAYEAIYNAFYRNQQNDPFLLNGVAEYNRYITNNEGGADDTVYDFFNRNWELDFLTSATQTPQQGDITPLVGVSASGDFTFDNGDGTTTVVHPTIGSDGSTLTGIAAYEGTTPADGSLPAGVRRLQELIPYGISINDFRNVNALQRWLETNLRRGYKYRDQIKSHFDVDVEYKELDMPEFIGGMSEPVIVNQVNQAVDQTPGANGYGSFEEVLGSYAGQASILAQSEHDISHYCDEHGFIIGIMSISPVPNYSQLLPKHLIKDNVLDYYFPEFGHIGNQPITYREVVPLQSYLSGDSLDDVFGYQRAWYDYIASVDEVHGDMRMSLRNFLMNRVFDKRPELGREFLQVDAEHLNDVFSVTDDTDKIIGQIFFEVTAQRPIPKFGIPRLE